MALCSYGPTIGVDVDASEVVVRHDGERVAVRGPRGGGQLEHGHIGPGLAVHCDALPRGHAYGHADRYVSIHVSVHIPTHVSIHMSICMPTHTSMRVSMHVSIRMSTHRCARACLKVHGARRVLAPAQAITM